jgi:hypothetical protein
MLQHFAGLHQYWLSRINSTIVCTLCVAWVDEHSRALMNGRSRQLAADFDCDLNAMDWMSKIKITTYLHKRMVFESLTNHNRILRCETWLSVGELNPGLPRDRWGLECYGLNVKNKDYYLLTQKNGFWVLDKSSVVKQNYLLRFIHFYVGSFCLSNTLNFSFFPTSFWGSHAQIPSVPSLGKPLLRLFLIAFERKSRQDREKKKCQTTSNAQRFIITNLIQKSGMKKKMAFGYQNCSEILWEHIVLVSDKNFWNSRLKAEKLQNFWDPYWFDQVRPIFVTECFISDWIY